MKVSVGLVLSKAGEEESVLVFPLALVHCSSGGSGVPQKAHVLKTYPQLGAIRM
jgi:hypothetical protein